MTNFVFCETSVSGDTSATHAEGAGSIPAFRSNNYQNTEKLSVEPIKKEIAKTLALENHYSKKWNPAFGTENFGLFHNKELLGVAVFGNAMNPRSWKSITSIDPKFCLELNRLWVDDLLTKNSESWFLSQCFRLLKLKGYGLIQSFADGRLGVGTIYQATNFDYYGFHKTLFHEHVETKEIFHDAPFTDTRFPRPMVKKNLLHQAGVLKTFRVHTYRYLLGLNRYSKKSIKLSSKPFPKEQIGFEKLENYKPPSSQIARAAALAKNLGDETDFQKLANYLETLCDDAKQLLDIQSQNKFVQKVSCQPSLF